MITSNLDSLNTTFLTRLVTLNGDSIKLGNDFDYLVVLNWARFIGRLNKELTLAYSKKLLHSDFGSKRIKVIYLNLDPNESWKEMGKIKISRKSQP